MHPDTFSGADDPAKIQATFKRAIEELGHQPLSKPQAGLRLAMNIAKQIVEGRLDPYTGARRIWWTIWNECPELFPQLNVFVGLASELEDDPGSECYYRNEIVEEAKKLLVADHASHTP